MEEIIFGVKPVAKWTHSCRVISTNGRNLLCTGRDLCACPLPLYHSERRWGISRRHRVDVAAPHHTVSPSTRWRWSVGASK